MSRRVRIGILFVCLLGLPGLAWAVADARPAVADLLAAVHDAEFVVAPRNAVAIVLPPRNLPELPEPAVFAMMLLGVCVIGYRARGASEEKFR